MEDDGFEAIGSVMQLPSTAADAVGTAAREGKRSKSYSGDGSFQAFNLERPVFQGIMSMGFSVPTPIQRRAIPPLLAGSDAVIMARTGAGKTAAFLIPLVNKLRRHSGTVGVRAIVMSPTRELAIQTFRVCRQLSKQTDLRIALTVGGHSLDSNFFDLTANPDIIIATPGRLSHIVTEIKLRLSKVEVCVLDEADRLFEMGFAADIASLFRALPPPSARQVVLCSATLPPAVSEFATAGLTSPTLVRLDDATLPDTLAAHHVATRAADRFAALALLLRACRDRARCLVFVATHQHAEWVTGALDQLGVCAQVQAVHGQLDMTQRAAALSAFTRFGRGVAGGVDEDAEEGTMEEQLAAATSAKARRKIKEKAKKDMEKAMKGAVRGPNVLVVTDVAARGLDLPYVEYVFNYDFPASPKLYIHRAGRAARAGREGECISFVLPDLSLHIGSDRATVGAFPSTSAAQLSSQIERLDHNAELADYKKQMTNASKAYYRSRAAASSAAIRRVRDALALGTNLPTYTVACPFGSVTGAVKQMIVPEGGVYGSIEQMPPSPVVDRVLGATADDAREAATAAATAAVEAVRAAAAAEAAANGSTVSATPFNPFPTFSLAGPVSIPEVSKKVQTPATSAGAMSALPERVACEAARGAAVATLRTYAPPSTVFEVSVRERAHRLHKRGGHKPNTTAGDAKAKAEAAASASSRMRDEVRRVAAASAAKLKASGGAGGLEGVKLSGGGGAGGHSQKDVTLARRGAALPSLAASNPTAVFEDVDGGQLDPKAAAKAAGAEEKKSKDKKDKGKKSKDKAPEPEAEVEFVSAVPYVAPAASGRIGTTLVGGPLGPTPFKYAGSGFIAPTRRHDAEDDEDAVGGRSTAAALRAATFEVGPDANLHGAALSAKRQVRVWDPKSKRYKKVDAIHAGTVVKGLKVRNEAGKSVEAQAKKAGAGKLYEAWKQRTNMEVPEVGGEESSAAQLAYGHLRVEDEDDDEDAPLAAGNGPMKRGRRADSVQFKRMGVRADKAAAKAAAKRMAPGERGGAARGAAGRKTRTASASDLGLKDAPAMRKSMQAQMRSKIQSMPKQERRKFLEEQKKKGRSLKQLIGKKAPPSKAQQKKHRAPGSGKGSKGKGKGR